MRVEANSTAPLYRGRFAPSPTGPLHFGSLIAATASYLQAQANHGEWLVRIEDIDPPRELPGATESILKCLETHGFDFSEPHYQSAKLDRYAEITTHLLASDAAYPCSCSRRQLQQIAQPGRAGSIYPGTCRNGAANPQATSVRIRTSNQSVKFTDLLQGPQSCALESEIGDFLLRRGDGYVAYQLAVAVDDYEQQITEVVRGTDLLDSTFMQIWLQQVLNYDKPQYMHFPVAVDTNGAKLSKQTGACEVDPSKPITNIIQALEFLKQNPEESLKSATLKDLWGWAIENWQPANLAGLQSLPDKSMILQ